MPAGVFENLVRFYGILCLLSREGDCADNAPTESWFGTFKNERIHGELTVD
jgi:transposase InsO family protein